MKKIKIFTLLALLLMLVTSCASDGLQDGISENIVNDGDNVSENQMDGLREDPQGEQPEEWLEEQEEDIQSTQINDSIDVSAEEIVCENLFFFPKNITSITAEMNYYSGSFKKRTTVELNLHWVKQYENGCLAKLSIIPFDGMPDYMDDARLNTYFYVTDSEIYRISPSIVEGDEIITFYNDDALMVSILDTDEKLIEYGELLCSPEGMEDSLREENEESDYYENYIWEEGAGLISYESGYSMKSGEESEIVILKDIMYGTTDQTEDKDVVCTNPYFFPQDVSSLKADLTYLSYDCLELFVTISGELELHWLKQYEDGCLVRLSVVPFDDIPNYMDLRYLNFYFYVTSDKIYRIHFYAASEYFNTYLDGICEDSERFYYYQTAYDSASRSFEHMDIYIEHNDNLLISVLNSDERLLKYGELVFTMEEICNEVGMEETGVELHIRQEGEQVIYSRALVAPYNHYTLWENYRWENGCGLVEYRIGRSAEAEPFYIKNFFAE